MIIGTLQISKSYDFRANEEDKGKDEGANADRAMGEMKPICAATADEHNPKKGSSRTRAGGHDDSATGHWIMGNVLRSEKCVYPMKAIVMVGTESTRARSLAMREHTTLGHYQRPSHNHEQAHYHELRANAAAPPTHGEGTPPRDDGIQRDPHPPTNNANELLGIHNSGLDLLGGDFLLIALRQISEVHQKRRVRNIIGSFFVR
ncbi:hypothetical protein B0H13DRAFT_1888579 [Mycena leptocephala]|nr:hypothetical protein B0H13DRAFT_1888579 [Mycena leptocephala]